MLLNIHYHKHEIGIHPGYNTYQDSGAFASSVDKLKQVMIEEGIEQPIFGGRYIIHWKTPTTAQIYEKWIELRYNSWLRRPSRLSLWNML